jgi:RNA-directed DNA polymerase
MPQGGVISPLLNIASYGLEEAAGVRYVKPGDRAEQTKTDSPVVIRYADDLVALCHTHWQAEQVKAKLAERLAPRGLVVNDDKTRIVHVGQSGFDFLGFNVRRYNGKLLIKPSKAAIRRIRERLRTEMHALRGSNPRVVIAALNPVVKGWAAYYRGVVSKRTFNVLDDYMWSLTYKWAIYSHPNKSTWWVTSRYFGKFNKFRNNRWVFGDAACGAHLAKFAWTDIVRHTLVKGRASPDDPALIKYWAER